MCEKEIPYWDMKNPPKVCESRVCITNYEYQQKHKDPITGKMPSPEEIKKW
jgi:hypothetical protein